MKRIVETVRRWWPSGLVLCAVLWLTLAPDPAPDVSVPMWLGKYADKVVHAVMMGGLTGAIIFDYMRKRDEGRGREMSRGAGALVAVGMLVFSALDEWAQGAMHLGRTADPLDWVADATGIVLAVVLAPGVCGWVIRNSRV